jgi:hypothetical protein
MVGQPRHPVVPAILLLAALYGVASALLFNLVVGPFAGAAYVGEAVLSAVVVAIPYGLLYFAYRLVGDRSSFYFFAASAAVVVLSGGVLYSGGFGPNDGEYALVFLLAPLLQLPFVLLTLAVSLWNRRARRRAA